MKEAIYENLEEYGPLDEEGNQLAPEAAKLSTLNADVVDNLMEEGSGTISWARVWTDMHKEKARGEAGKEK